jgi:hypothetical protein
MLKHIVLCIKHKITLPGSLQKTRMRAVLFFRAVARSKHATYKYTTVRTVNKARIGYLNYSQKVKK